MIRLTMHRQAEGSYTGFTCEGHAGFGEYGQDIVCAGVSALVITTVRSIEALAPDEVTASSDEETGFVACELGKPASKEAALLLGCEAIREEYGNEYITITFREVS